MVHTPSIDGLFLFLPGEGYVLVDAGDVAQFLDRFAAEQLDLPREDVVGRASSYWWPELTPVLAEFRAGNVAGGRLVGGAIDATVARNGDHVDIRIFATDDGIGVALLHRAGTEPVSKPEQRALERVLHTMKEPVVITTAEPFDRPGPVIVYVNDALKQLTGYSRAEVLGRSPRLFQGPDVDRATLARFHDAYDTWGELTVEVLNRAKDGTPYWVEIDMSSLADDSGWYTHWVAVQRNVTDRKTEDARRDSELAMMQSILDSLPAQTALLAANGDIIAVNQPWRRVWTDTSGAPEPDWTTLNYLEVCRRAVHSHLPGALDAEVVAAGIEAVSNGELATYSHDYELTAPEANEWFHLPAVPLNGAAGVVVTHSDITRRKVLEAELGYRSTHDALTGLANRDLLRARLNDELREAASDESWQLAVIFIDLDDFKDVNDGLGHHAGDRLLEVVGERLEELVSPAGMAARLGGDEFVLVTRISRDEWAVMELMRAVQAAIAEPIVLDLTTLQVSASVGVVTSPPHRGDATEILRDADTAMYASKRAGRDRWMLYTDNLREEAAARLITNERIAQALRDEEFALVFQPVIDLDSGQTVASEALLRWYDPNRGIIAPGDFLPLLDSGPLIEKVGAWVIDHALSVQARWQQHEVDARHLMSVNVSTRQLGRGSLPSIVRDALHRWGVPPGNLCLEIVEDTLLAGGPAPLAEIGELRAAGVLIAMDDFGIGYSSMSYLHQFPVDVIKIDRMFASGSDAQKLEGLLGAKRGMGDALGAFTVAEGIETVDQMRLMKGIGIHYGQGFLLGRPIAPGDRPAACTINMTSLM